MRLRTGKGHQKLEPDVMRHAAAWFQVSTRRNFPLASLYTDSRNDQRSNRKFSRRNRIAGMLQNQGIKALLPTIALAIIAASSATPSRFEELRLRKK